jgi:hypothetical protein
LQQSIGGDGIEAMEIFLGRACPQDGVKLTLQPQVVKTMGLSAPKSLCLIGMQTKASHQPDDGIDIGR